MSDNRQAATILKALRRAPRKGRHVVAVEVSGGVVVRVATTAPDPTFIIADHDELGAQGDDADPRFLDEIEAEIQALPFNDDQHDVPRVPDEPSPEAPTLPERLRTMAAALDRKELAAHACAAHLRAYANDIEVQQANQQSKESQLELAINKLGAVELESGRYAFKTASDRWYVTNTLGILYTAATGQLYHDGAMMQTWWNPEQRYAWRIRVLAGENVYAFGSEEKLVMGRIYRERYPDELAAQAAISDLHEFNADHELLDHPYAAQRITVDLNTGEEMPA